MQRLKLTLFLLVAAIVLGLGISSPTGLTGKDEYLLGQRIPLEMMQDDRWWVPFIDGAPRLKKPPFVYWMARASYETFGPSLTSARGVTVGFALLLLACTAWLGKHLSGSARTGLLAAAILLGMGGLATESRRLMLDVPVAALATAAYCCYLRWLQTEARLGAMLWSLIGAALLSAALLTKGPIAIVVFAAGLLALISMSDVRGTVFQRWWQHGLLAFLAVLLPAYWFSYVQGHHGAEFTAAAQDELEARQLLNLSASPLLSMVSLALPWSFVAMHALWVRRKEPLIRFLGLWLLLSLLPFFFIRTFDRYLIGSLVPLALLTAIHIANPLPTEGTRRLGRWLGSVLPIAITLACAALLWRFERAAWAWLALPLFYFIWAWWRPALNTTHLTASAALLWCAGWGLAFPALGVNAVPQTVLDLTRERPVIMFAGPQPALLPILSQRPLRQTSRLNTVELSRGTLISVRLEDVSTMKTQLQALGVSVRPIHEYRSLTSAGSGVKFAREGATRDDWLLAWQARSVAPLMSTVRFYEVQP